MSTRSWSATALLREAFLNGMNIRSRTIIGLAVAIAAGSIAATFHLSETTQFAQRLDELENRGSNIITIQSTTPDAKVAIGRSSCEALSRLPDVQRAGLLVDAGSRDIPEVGAKTRTFAASTTLFPQLAMSPGVLGFNLTPTRAPRMVRVAPNQTQLLAIGTRQPAGIPTNSAVVFPLPAGTTSGPVCVVAVSRFSNPKTAGPLLASALNVRGGPILANQQLPLTSDPIHDWQNRPGQYLPLALGLFGGLLTSTLTWTRSSELAAYRLSGTSRRSIGILLTLESLFPAGTFFLSGTAALIALNLVGSDSFNPAEQLMWFLSGAAAWIAVATVGTLRSILASPAKMSREK